MIALANNLNSINKTTTILDKFRFNKKFENAFCSINSSNNQYRSFIIFNLAFYLKKFIFN